MNLSNSSDFPDPTTIPSGQDNGLIAVGGGLEIKRLVAAYRKGIFPWSVNPVTWWSPDPRGILELDDFHQSKSLPKIVRRKIFRITINQCFREVIQGCAAQRQGATWISPEFVDAYCQLHAAGVAHSIECWCADGLAGGIYGVAIGGLFAGESMFHTVDNASKVALGALVTRLRERQFSLFDLQMVTPFTRQVGAKNISRSEYLGRLKRALEQECFFAP